MLQFTTTDALPAKRGRGNLDCDRHKVIRSYVHNDAHPQFFDAPPSAWTTFESDNIASFKAAHHRYLKTYRLDYTFRFEHIGGIKHRVIRIK